MDETPTPEATEPTWTPVRLLDRTTVRIRTDIPGGLLLDVMSATNDATWITAMRKAAARALHDEDLAALSKEWYDTGTWSFDDIVKALSELQAALLARPTGAGSGSASG